VVVKAVGHKKPFPDVVADWTESRQALLKSKIYNLGPVAEHHRYREDEQSLHQLPDDRRESISKVLWFFHTDRHYGEAKAGPTSSCIALAVFAEGHSSG